MSLTYTLTRSCLIKQSCICKGTWKCKGSSTMYVHKISQKSNISNPLIHTRTCAYQGVRNVSFSENLAYVLNGWPPMTKSSSNAHNVWFRQLKNWKFTNWIFLTPVNVCLQKIYFFLPNIRMFTVRKDVWVRK